jgi:hypothetical protein
MLPRKMNPIPALIVTEYLKSLQIGSYCVAASLVVPLHWYQFKMYWFLKRFMKFIMNAIAKITPW